MFTVQVLGQEFILLVSLDFQDGVRFFAYFDVDYELDADSVEEKNKVSTGMVVRKINILYFVS